MIATGQNILNTLGYFDLFQYPLTRDEIYLFHSTAVSHMDIDIALGILVQDKAVFRLDEFYSLQNDLLLAERRRKGNELAIKQMLTAKRVAKRLSRFPYVKGIAVSGSLSKNFATEKTDIDFFIVTTAGRLWISRTYMHLYKKFTFLTGRQNWYCMNYYVDEDELEIAEKNIFTAMEIVTLVPMQGKSSLQYFFEANEWTKKYFPAREFSVNDVPEIKNNIIRNLLEKILNGRMGDWIDSRLMGFTQKRWQKKTRMHRVNSKGECLGMIVGPHFSKPDPRNFQDKVVEQYNVKMQQLLQLQNKTATLIL